MDNVSVDASSNVYLNSTYYENLSNIIKNKIVTHSFAIGPGIANHSKDQINIDSLNNTWTGKIGLLTLSDVLNASEENIIMGSSNINVSNYITNIANRLDVLWTMTKRNTNTYDAYVVAKGNQAGARRVSRYNQVSGNETFTMYLVPSFYVKSDGEYYGTGTNIDPFIIK